MSVLCICTDGFFQCTDGAGQAVAPGTAPRCPKPKPAGEGSCFPTLSSAEFANCTDPGLLCAYPSACPGRFDQCQCFPGKVADGGVGLRFECTRVSCGSDDGGNVALDSGRASDAESVDADSASVFDAAADSRFDAATDSRSDSAADGSVDGDASTDGGG